MISVGSAQKRKHQGRLAAVVPSGGGRSLEKAIQSVSASFIRLICEKVLPLGYYFPAPYRLQFAMRATRLLLINGVCDRVQSPIQFSPMNLDAEKLSVTRLGRQVLQEVSLRIEDGQCVSIIGPNGAGKSTLMAALLGLLPMTGGTVRLSGTPIGHLHRREIARQVAYVPQIHEGYLGFRVRDVIEAGRYAYVDALAGLSSADELAITQAAAAAHVLELMDRTVDTLSGGERQKVWIAAALAQATPAMFLDEPTNALDPAHQAELIRLMRDLHAAGKMLVVICHDLNVPLALGGRVIAIRDRGIMFDGPVEKLCDVTLLRRIYDTDFTLHRNPQSDGYSIQLAV